QNDAHASTEYGRRKKREAMFSHPAKGVHTLLNSTPTPSDRKCTRDKNVPQPSLGKLSPPQLTNNLVAGNLRQNGRSVSLSRLSKGKRFSVPEDFPRERLRL